MIEDGMKILGFGKYMDWRYRQGMSRLDAIGNASTPEEFYNGPGKDLLLSDPVMVDYFFPFLKYRMDGIAVAGFSPDKIAIMTRTLEIAQESVITKSSWSLLLETGLLCRQPQGELVPDTDELPELVQFLYEKLFFDVRPFLGKPDILCRLLFSDPERLKRRDGYDLVAKVFAYALDFQEFTRWRNGGKTKATKAVENAMHSLNDYLTGLEILNVDKPADLVEAYARLFAMLPDIVASAKGDSEEAAHRSREYLLRQTLDTVALIAQMAGMDSEKVRIFGGAGTA